MRKYFISRFFPLQVLNNLLDFFGWFYKSDIVVHQAGKIGFVTLPPILSDGRILPQLRANISVFCCGNGDNQTACAATDCDGTGKIQTTIVYKPKPTKVISGRIDPVVFELLSTAASFNISISNNITADLTSDPAFSLGDRALQEVCRIFGSSSLLFALLREADEDTTNGAAKTPNDTDARANEIDTEREIYSRELLESVLRKTRYYKRDDTKNNTMETKTKEDNSLAAA